MFGIEQVLVLLAFILSVSVITDFPPDRQSMPALFTALLINMFISVALAVYFKTYGGLVRHAGFRDIRRILQFSFCQLIAWSLILLVWRNGGSFRELTLGFPIVNSCICSTLLTGLRLLVRGIYNRRDRKSDKDWKSRMFHVEELTHLTIGSLLEREEISLQNEEAILHFNDCVVLISGAAGSIGSEIGRQLSRYPVRRIILLDQSESGLSNLEFELRNKNEKADICIEVASVRDKNRLEEIFNRYKPDYVFHAAAYKHVSIMESFPSEAVLTNVMGTRILADVSIHHKVRKFIMVSTDKGVNPSSIMGATKSIAEIYVQSLSKKTEGTQFITTRFGNVLGSNGSVVPLFIKQILSGGPITITHPEVSRYFMSIPEASRLVVEACAMGRGGEIFVFNMGKPVKILQIAEKLIRLAGYTPGKEIGIEFIGLRPGEKIHEDLFNESESLIPTYHPKIMKAKTREIEPALFKGQLEMLIEYGLQHEQTAVRDLIQTMVPNFKE